MREFRDVFARAAELAAQYRESVAERPVAGADLAALREGFGGPLPEKGLPPLQVLEALAAAAEPGPAVQRSGVCWLGGTTWHGRRLMRVSFSNGTTTQDDVDRAAAEILRLAADIA